MTPLEESFSRDVYSIFVNEREFGIRSTRLEMMVDRYNPVEAAHRLLQPDRNLPETTFSYLRDIGHPELSVEHFVVQEKYSCSPSRSGRSHSFA